MPSLPERQTFEPVGLTRRFSAMFYEGILLVGVLLLAALPVVALTGVTPESTFFPLFALYVYTVAFLYLGWNWVRGGQTLAMKTWRFRVVEANAGRDIGWDDALLRYIWALPYWLLLLLAVHAQHRWPPAVALALWAALFAALALSVRDPKKRMLHDVLSKTVLVSDPRASANAAECEQADGKKDQ